MSLRYRLSFALSLPTACLLAAMIGCGGSPTQVSDTGGAAPAGEPATGADDAAAELAAKEEELARREAALALEERERELARREAELAAKETASKTSKPTKPSAAAEPPPPAKATPVVVPPGTRLSVEFVSPLSTKTAKVGDRVDARLAEDLVVDGRRVAAAGARVEGSVTQVVSGSKKIGGTPTLGVNFDGLELAGGGMASISGQLVQQGKSDTAKDSAKIAGAAVAGAIIGHQIDDDKGKLIGGLIGGAAGTAAAAKTGGEVEVPAGMVVDFVLDAPVQID